MRPLPLHLAASSALFLGLVGSDAHAQSLRFTETAPGSVRATGNTLGLSKQLNDNGPGIEDSIGTFVSLSASVDNVPATATTPAGRHHLRLAGERLHRGARPAGGGRGALRRAALGRSYDYPPDVVTASWTRR